ncbi:hypothetical protein [Prevotella sp. oral taxon 299]|jgi:hypothetical protein|uniref:hypothetical protein n=1 Tax=Prevotella sp. oral taxon 299 TaxID=652716 RepID=UPI0001C3F9CD|nr:hypothetical protein [Prevotella sp. oral taxon 299]EFC70767.1 hypothetical protein HMPREF0669_01222 [Prevotella sp. oral taxon 299 str. F0039]RKW52323.1 MAG: hypothetical protein D8H98_18485 [Prevotella sp.]
MLLFCYCAQNDVSLGVAKIEKIGRTMLKINQNYILTLCVLALVILCYLSIRNAMGASSENKESTKAQQEQPIEPASQP